MTVTNTLVAALRRARPGAKGTPEEFVTEFCVEAAWVRRVVATRAARLLQLRRHLRARERLALFRGFEFSCLDASGESPTQVLD